MGCLSRPTYSPEVINGREKNELRDQQSGTFIRRILLETPGFIKAWVDEGMRPSISRTSDHLKTCKHSFIFSLHSYGTFDEYFQIKDTHRDNHISLTTPGEYVWRRTTMTIYSNIHNTNNSDETKIGRASEIPIRCQSSIGKLLIISRVDFSNSTSTDVPKIDGSIELTQIRHQLVIAECRRRRDGGKTSQTRTTRENVWREPTVVERKTTDQMWARGDNSSSRTNEHWGKAKTSDEAKIIGRWRWVCQRKEHLHSHYCTRSDNVSAVLVTLRCFISRCCAETRTYGIDACSFLFFAVSFFSSSPTCSGSFLSFPLFLSFFSWCLSVSCLMSTLLNEKHTRRQHATPR